MIVLRSLLLLNKPEEMPCRKKFQVPMRLKIVWYVGFFGVFVIACCKFELEEGEEGLELIDS